MENQVLPVKFNKIHINPKFRNAHINPTFFTKPPPPTIPANIHVNPKFFIRPPEPPAPEKFTQKEPIYKTRRKIIRNVPPPGSVVKGAPSTRLVKISKNKLVRTSNGAPVGRKRSPVRRETLGRNLYKIDRRSWAMKVPPQNLRKLRSSFSPKIITTSNKKLMRM